MTQHDLDRAVARATGESLSAIRRRGFSLATPLEPDFDPEPAHGATPDAEPDTDPDLSLFLDWDELHIARNIGVVQRPPHAYVA